MVAMLAASLSLSAQAGAQAQSMGVSTSSASTDSASDAASNSGASSSATGAAGTSAPLPGVNNGSSASTTGDDSTKATAPTSEVPPGVLWTDPKYAVKEVPPPAKVAVPTKPGAKDKKDDKDAKAAEAAKVNEYDDKEAQSFADSVGNPQYVWTRQDTETKGKKAAALNASKEMHEYNRKLVENFVSHMTVPNSATLVENSSNKYVYLFSFTIDSKGKISHIHSENSYGQFTALNLADDSENSKMTASITDALAKCSPVKVPPAGISPWYMLLRYEPNTGKVFVANLNTI